MDALITKLKGKKGLIHFQLYLPDREEDKQLLGAQCSHPDDYNEESVWRCI